MGGRGGTWWVREGCVHCTLGWEEGGVAQGLAHGGREEGWHKDWHMVGGRRGGTRIGTWWEEGGVAQGLAHGGREEGWHKAGWHMVGGDVCICGVGRLGKWWVRRMVVHMMRE
jgi:hypothetical protein